MTHNSQRAIAWRNLMVAAINAGLEQGVFGLAEDDNRWPGAADPVMRTRGSYRLTLPNGAPCAQPPSRMRVSVS